MTNTMEKLCSIHEELRRQKELLENLTQTQQTPEYEEPDLSQEPQKPDDSFAFINGARDN